MKISHLIINLCIFATCLCSCQKKGKTEKDGGYVTYENYAKMIEQKIEEQIQANLHKLILNQEVYFGLDSVKTVAFYEIVGKHKFFFCFSSQTCHPCIENTVDCIKKVFSEYETDDEIIFIASDYPAKMKDNFFGKKLITLQNKQLGIPLEQEYVPFLFTLDDSMKINKLHIVNKNDFTNTKKFLEDIKAIKI
jgi:hypothetical protein